MQDQYRIVLGCILCIATLCLSASAQFTATEGTPTIALEPENTVVAENQTVTVTYDVTVKLTGDSKAGNYTVNWSCYVKGDLYTGFPKASSGSFIALAGSFTVQESFTITESNPDTYPVYCTASGEVTDNGSTKNIGPETSATQEFTVSACSGSVTVTDDEQASSAAYIAMDYNLTPTMNPSYSGNQDVTIGPYQGITGDLTAAGLDLDCDGGNNDDLPEEYPVITETGQTSGSNSVTFSWQITQYGYSWDDCTSCDAPPGAVENVHFQTANPGTAIYQKAFSCGEQ